MELNVKTTFLIQHFVNFSNIGTRPNWNPFVKFDSFFWPNVLKKERNRTSCAAGYASVTRGQGYPPKYFFGCMSCNLRRPQKFQKITHFWFDRLYFQSNFKLFLVQKWEEGITQLKLNYDAFQSSINWLNSLKFMMMSW